MFHIFVCVLRLEMETELTADDFKIKVSGCDIDGISRGKIMIKDKFVKCVNDGFGFHLLSPTI